jgi:hypothetical protein
MATCILHDKKIIYIHIPKCAGSATTRFLNFTKDPWTILSSDGVQFAANALDTVENINDYKIFTIIRDPVAWSLSGYKFTKREYPEYSKTYKEHLEYIYNKTNWHKVHLEWNIRWHCAILPDQHIQNYKVAFFKLETDIPLLIKWLSKKVNIKYKRYNLPIENNIELNENIEFDKSTLEMCQNLYGNYAQKFNYNIVDSIKKLQLTNRYITTSF